MAIHHEVFSRAVRKMLPLGIFFKHYFETPTGNWGNGVGEEEALTDPFPDVHQLSSCWQTWTHSRCQNQHSKAGVSVEASLTLMLLILQWYGKSEKERRSHGKDAAVCADHYPNQMKPDASFPVQFPTCSTLCYEQYLLQRRGLVGISNRKCRNLLIMLLARGYITAT